MSYSAFKSYQTKSFLGEINPTSGDHIFISAVMLTIRGITYKASAHFYKWPSGEWGLGEAGDPPSRIYYSHLSPHRITDVYSKLRDVSHTARVKIAEILTAEIAAWVKDNPGALVEAHEDEARREIEKREHEIGTLEGQITKLKLEIASLRQK